MVALGCALGPQPPETPTPTGGEPPLTIQSLGWSDGSWGSLVRGPVQCCASDISKRPRLCGGSLTYVKDAAILAEFDEERGACKRGSAKRNKSGHPAPREMDRSLGMAGAKPRVVRYVARDFKIPVCEAKPKPKAARPAVLPECYEPGKVVIFLMRAFRHSTWWTGAQDTRWLRGSRTPNRTTRGERLRIPGIEPLESQNS